MAAIESIPYDDFDDELPTAIVGAAYCSGHGEDDGCCNAIHRMSHFSLESDGDDADAEPSSEDEESKSVAKAAVAGGGGGGMQLDGSDKEDSLGAIGVASMPGTPACGIPAGSRTEWSKEYASETEARDGGGRRRRHRRGRQSRERWLERAWQMKKSHAAAEDGSDAGGGAAECRVVVRPLCCGSGRMCMDLEEVRACRDLGIGLPGNWTVEIPETFSDLTADTSSGGNSPVNWRISSPGDDPVDVKARLKVWAQAVALTSASRLSG